MASAPPAARHLSQVAVARPLASHGRLIAGVLVCWAVAFFDSIHIDDPVGAISVHGINGAFGVLAVGIFGAIVVLEPIRGR